MSLMSSGRADKVVNTLHTASIILPYSVSTQLGNICTKHIQSVAREGFHCFVQILLNSDLCDLMRFEPQVVWTGFFTQQRVGGRAGSKPPLSGRESCAAPHRLGGAVCVSSSFGSTFSL